MTKDTRTAGEWEDRDSTKEESLRILARAIALQDNDDRMKDLLADFYKGRGFAKGWRMAVGEWFRDSLDIKQIKRTEVPADEATDEVVGDRSGAKWTQGGAFSFSQGDTIYDTPRAYQRWDIALKSVCMAYQVLDATPSRPKKETTYLKRNAAFTGSLRGGRSRANLGRREKVVNAIPLEWEEERKIIDAVKQATNEATHHALLVELCDLGALDRRVDVEPRFPGVIRLQVMVPNAERSNLYVKEEKILSQDDFVAMLIAGKGLSS